MTDEELEALLDELEAGLAEDVQAALSLTAREFATAVDASTELVAAAFSVSRIGGMWRRRVNGILTSLRRIAGRAARVTAEGLGESIPTPNELEPVLGPYIEATRGLLNAVGDRLSADATQSLAEGVAAGETQDELKRRLTTLFDDDGTELGPTRANRIATTEATRAFNAGTLAAAQSLTGLERPLVKQWVTRRDERVRTAHKDADGQLRFLDDPFQVGDTDMQYPGDPTAPADLTINCRCIMKAQAAPVTERTASMDTEEFQSRMPAPLKKYWLSGEGAAKIRWGTPGDFDRCVRALRPDFPENPEGLCANLHHEALGKWPGQEASGAAIHTGAMVALMPRAEDAERLALASGEAVDQLHLTLYYLGEAADWSDEQQARVKRNMQNLAAWLTPIQARAFGVAQWNPFSDEPAWVWNVGDDKGDRPSQDTLMGVHREVSFYLEDSGNPLPSQYTPWSPHICAAYGTADLDEMVSKTGPVVFDRIRVAFAGEYVDFPLLDREPEEEPEYVEAYDYDLNESETELSAPPSVLVWTTPDETALAFENQQTGDGRVFAPGALYWDGAGPWPLQYAEEMLGGHDGAELAGAIEFMGRDEDRITGTGVLYLTQRAGSEAAMLLSMKAPLGVSVDLDDVDIEVIDTVGGQADTFHTRLLTASVLPTPEGGFWLSGETQPVLKATADGGGLVHQSERVAFMISPEGRVPRNAFELDAAAGDPDMAGEVLDVQRSGDFLMRITRGRVRGATLVTIPAYANARITLDPSYNSFGSPTYVTAAAATSDYDRVVRHVRKSVTPLTASDIARFLNISIVAVRRYLARAAKKGELVRLTRGNYVAPSAPVATTVASVADDLTELVASVTGAVDLPVADRDTVWDGDAAATRVFDWADGDADKIGKAFAYRDDDKDPLTKAAYKLGYADVDEGGLVIIPAGVAAALGALHGARGGVDLPEDERDAVQERLEAVRAHVTEETGGDEMDDLQASAWNALKEAPPFRAEWFREPTMEELPPDGPGVNYENGRIFGWVAQANEPHAGHAKKITINTLGRIDTTHFLRQRFTLDDGSTVKAGAYTMNVGHHRDSAECETAACQFDDTRTVAGIVTVGMNERGMWFSGAAAPWLSEWDRAVFKATQPSYHMRKGPSGNWQLRAVLGVPVPGHSSPLLASAVIERSQVALTASATIAEAASAEAAITAEEEFRKASPAVLPMDIDYDRLADAIVAATTRAEMMRADQARRLEELRAMADTMISDDTATEGA